jgi:hypothetical protein
MLPLQQQRIEQGLVVALLVVHVLRFECNHSSLLHRIRWLVVLLMLGTHVMLAWPSSDHTSERQGAGRVCVGEGLAPVTQFTHILPLIPTQLCTGVHI